MNSRSIRFCCNSLSLQLLLYFANDRSTMGWKDNQQQIQDVSYLGCKHIAYSIAMLIPAKQRRPVGGGFRGQSLFFGGWSSSVEKRGCLPFALGSPFAPAAVQQCNSRYSRVGTCYYVAFLSRPAIEAPKRLF